jgi:hypothetical protein
LLLSTTTGAQLAGELDGATLRQAIERGLAAAPRGFEALLVPSQTGVRVLDVNVQRTSSTGQRVTIDLSQKTLTYDPTGNVEAIVDQVLSSTAALTNGAGDVEYRLLVEGLPLDQFLARPQGSIHPAARSWTRRQGRRQCGPWMVLGRTVGVVAASARLLLGHRRRLRELGVRRVPAGRADRRRPRRAAARYPGRDASTGDSGRPAWQESAKYFIKALGAPWDVSDFGVDNYARDINSRPFYANWIDSAVMISIHNNGGGGTGTETWFDETNGYEPESHRLARLVNDKGGRGDPVAVRPQLAGPRTAVVQCVQR